MQNDSTPQEAADTNAPRGWRPPPVFIRALDKFIEHNRKHPKGAQHLGAIKIAAWLKKHGLEVSKDAVYRWMKHRSNGTK